MSVIIRSNSGGGVGSYKGFPPGDVKIISKVISNNILKLKWEDPEDTVISGTTITSWAGTVLVIKEGSYPTSPDDGMIIVNSTTRNAYKSTYLERQLSTKNKIYCRFYTYNSDKIYNDSTSMIFCPPVASSNLADNSWETINIISESGEASSLWNIGDEIDIELNFTDDYLYNDADLSTVKGPCTETVTLQIWDFNHYDKSDGSGKAGITFGCKNVTNGSYKMDTRDSNIAYPNTKMRTITMPRILSYMQSDLQSVIKEVNIYSKNTTSAESDGLFSTDKVFLPGFAEVMSKEYSSESAGFYSEYYYNNNINALKKQYKFPIFTDNNSRIKTERSSDNKVGWWTRDLTLYSPSQYNTYNEISIWGYVTGYNALVGNKIYNYGRICFCFCV